MVFTGGLYGWSLLLDITDGLYGWSLWVVIKYRHYGWSLQIIISNGFIVIPLNMAGTALMGISRETTKR